MVSLRTDTQQSSRSLDIMKRELAPLLSAAGYRVDWRDPHGPVEATAATLVVVDLHGVCGLAAGDSAPEGPAAESRTLAATASSNGIVLPFSSLNCAALSRMLSAPLASEGGARREFLYGRAMARVLAHELYHILGHTRDHDKDGIAKPHFTVADLLGERFEFERAAITRIQRPAAAEASLEAPDRQ